MENIIKKIFESTEFIESNENFLSERDLQFSLALMLKQKKCSKVILEYPITKENYSNPDDFKGRNAYIDIYCEYNNKKYFIELKYKTKEILTKRHGLKPCFKLKSHYAHNDNIKLINNDICRLEQIIQKANSLNCIGYVLLLTNDNYYHMNEKLIKNTYHKATWKNFTNHNGFQYLLIEIQNKREN